MALETDLSQSPYFDDFNEETPYYRILHKPRFAVQTRELNQVQSILQDQINRFGRSVYKEGSIVEGCTLSFDNELQYIKIEDAYANGTAFTLADFGDRYVYNDNGLKALIVDTLDGFKSQAPNTNTLYVKYLNSAQYPNTGAQLTFDPGETLQIKTSANVLIGNVAVISNTGNVTIGDVTGFGYAVSTTEGIVFKKGTFLYVTPHTTIVTRYSNEPDGVSVGFDANETIVTSLANSALVDNAAGSPNYNAPGADRLQIVPELVVRDTVDVANTSSFFTIVDFKNGQAVTVKQTPEYSTLGADMARRTFETNGDFVVRPFTLSTAPIANTSDPNYATYNNLLVGRGLGYVKGYRVEYLNNNIIPLRKGTDYSNAAGQIVTANFGNYVYCSEFAGDFGDSNEVIEVELHNVAKTAITDNTRLSVSYSATTKIGTAYVRGFEYSSGTVGTPSAEYVVYLFGVVMNAGANFQDVRSIIQYDSGVLGVADVVLTYSATLATDIAQLEQTYNSGMLFPFGQKAIKTDGFSDTEFVYRRTGNTSFQTDGTATVTIPAAAGTGTEAFPYSGTLSASQAREFYVVSTETQSSANLTGTITVTSGQTNATGSSTLFLTEYSVGDYIKIGTLDPRLVISIANNTQLTIANTFGGSKTANTHVKTYVAGAPIDMGRSGRSISVSGSTATLTLDTSITEEPDTAFDISVFYNVNRSATVAIDKVVNKEVYVKIKCSNNTTTFQGPWSLGLPDVYKLDGVWINSGTTYAESGVNYVTNFTLDNGQRDAYYDLAKLTVVTNSPADVALNTNSTILVKLSAFTFDQSQGRGFFLGSSYPIDDANTANTNAITTAEIPLYYTTNGVKYDLRDSVDFRPYKANTAAVTQTLASATINPSTTTTLGVTPYLPAPDSVFQTDLEYYLKRIDRVLLNQDGSTVVVEGIPNATRPTAPAQRPGTMTLGFAAIPPYPSLATPEAKRLNRYDYAIATSIQQQRRYTMKDIGKIDRRVERLEYYTTLSALEQNTSNLQVKSDATGLNRYKNGFFVEPFADFSNCNTKNPEFYCAIDQVKTEMRPSTTVLGQQLIFDSARSTDVIRHGNLVMLDHDSDSLFISQNYASQSRDMANPSTQYNWVGSLTLNPPQASTPDVTVPADVLSNFQPNSNWTNLKNAWGTQWSTTKKDTTQAYLPAILVKFTAHGLRPNTRVYAYFDNVPVSSYCAPTASDFTGTGVSGAATSGLFGDPLTTNNAGSLYGFFYIASATFTTKNHTFLLTNAQAVETWSSASTYASDVFGATLATEPPADTTTIVYPTEDPPSSIDTTYTEPGPYGDNAKPVGYVPWFNVFGVEVEYAVWSEDAWIQEGGSFFRADENSEWIAIASGQDESTYYIGDDPVYDQWVADNSSPSDYDTWGYEQE